MGRPGDPWHDKVGVRDVARLTADLCPGAPDPGTGGGTAGGVAYLARSTAAGGDRTRHGGQQVARHQQHGEPGQLVATVTGQDLEQDAGGMFRIASRVAADRVISVCRS
jgi:hypothetical protein